MNLIRILFAAAVLVVFVPPAFSQYTPEKFVEDELLIKVSATGGEPRVRMKLQEIKAKVVERLSDTGWRRIKFERNTDLRQAIARLEATDGIEAVQPNFYYDLQATPNDPQYGLAGMYGLAKISAPAAWDITTGNSSVVVANIDTGVRYTHEDLAANTWTNSGEINNNGIDDDNNGFVDDFYGWDFFFNDSNPLDEHGHGTHTAGTIGALGNNNIGVVGVNWNVRIMTIKIYNSSGTGSTSAMLVNAYNYIRMMKERGVNIRVTNNSYGGCDEACGYDQATKDALDAMGNAGILNVFAAGNNGRNTDTNPFYPASYTSPTIISVANSTSTDTRSGSSNFGVETVDLAAPGTSILSTTRGTDSSYGTMSGTSMAAPHVSGVAALMAAQDPSLTPASIKASILNSVDVLTGWSSLVKTGGRLNAARALQNPTVCNFNLSTGPINVRTKGGIYTVNVSPGPNCDYSVKSDRNWIFVYGSEVRSGNGTVTFRVPVNTTVSRTGTVLIGGQALTVVQSRN